MSGFSATTLEKKLSELNPSSQSIQTVSLWLIHHRKHHKTIVQVWFKELQKAAENHKLTLMFLANDVIQCSRKKGPEYLKEFGNVLPKAFAHVFKTVSNSSLKNKLDHIINVWEERNVYSSDVILALRNGKGKKTKSPASTPPDKKEKEKAKKRKHSTPSPHKKNSTPEEVSTPRPTTVNLPSHEVLIKAVVDLENCASTDAVVREKIAKLPPEVSDVSLLDKIQSREAGEKLSKQVADALELLNDYNARLSTECEERKALNNMIREFIEGHSILLTAAENEAKELQEKLKKVAHVRHELKSHLQSLPDLTRLPSVTGGLAPLPTAENLFQ